MEEKQGKKSYYLGCFAPKPQTHFCQPATKVGNPADPAGDGTRFAWAQDDFQSKRLSTHSLPEFSGTKLSRIFHYLKKQLKRAEIFFICQTALKQTPLAPQNNSPYQGRIPPWQGRACPARRGCSASQNCEGRWVCPTESMTEKFFKKIFWLLLYLWTKVTRRRHNKC